MGELGVATSADVFSQQWNPAKYVFALENQAIGVSYTPYLSKLVDDIFLANLSFFTKNTDRSAWGASLKYFSLGDIQFNDLIGNTIVQQGIERPNELTIDLSYGLLLNKKFSMAVAARYNEVGLFEFAGPEAYRGRDQFNLILGMSVKPFVDLLIEKSQRITGKFAMETLDMNRAGAGGIGSAVPAVFVGGTEALLKRADFAAALR